jgi:transaldolase
VKKVAIKIYADGAAVDKIAELARDDRVAGFTTNPSLMRASGVQWYRAGAEAILHAARGKPVSVEILADDADNMEREAHGIAKLAKNVVVKVPVVNSRGEYMGPLIRRLCADGIPINVTAVFTVDQVRSVGEAIEGKSAIVSVFAGRIADAGVDPLAHVTKCCRALHEVCPGAEMLWASSRQVYDLRLAEQAGCDIITMSVDLLGKMRLLGKDLDEYSRETSAQFHRDAQASEYVL